MHKKIKAGDTLEFIGGKVSHMRNGVLYELVEGDLSVDLFKSNSQITTISNLPAIIEVTVDRVINRAFEAIELAKINPTFENLSRARMWVNLIEESPIKA